MSITQIEWDNLKKLAKEEEESDILCDSIECAHKREFYCDSEIKGKVTTKDIKILTKRTAKLFGAQEWVQTKKTSQVSRWKSQMGRYEYWNLEIGTYAALQIFDPDENDNIVWMAGCLHCHPFVETTNWSFCNSDGSTDESDLSDKMNPVNFLEDSSMSYIFHPRH